MVANGTGDQPYEKHDYINERRLSREDDELGDEEEDDDLDALIEELESQDGEHADCYEEEDADESGIRIVPEDLLQTDTRMGLNSAEVLVRRKKYGYNQMKGMLFYKRVS